MPTTRTIQDKGGVDRLCAALQDMPTPFRVTVLEGKGRSIDQNALLHKWFGEIARQKGDETLMDVKAQCNLTYGAPILIRDDEMWGRFWKAIGLSYEQRIKAFKLGYVQCTSLMTAKQLSEYMDAMSRDYRGEGFRLTDPEGWE